MGKGIYGASENGSDMNKIIIVWMEEMEGEGDACLADNLSESEGKWETLRIQRTNSGYQDE